MTNSATDVKRIEKWSIFKFRFMWMVGAMIQFQLVVKVSWLELNNIRVGMRLRKNDVEIISFT